MLTQEQQSKVLVLMDEYLKIRKSPSFDEQYKFDFFAVKHPDLVQSNHLLEDWQRIKKTAKNLVPFDEMRMSLFTHLMIYHEPAFKGLLQKLYDSSKRVGERVDAFESAIFDIVSEDPLWKNPKKMGFGATSFLLALNRKDEYLLMSVVKPFEKFLKRIPADLGEMKSSGDRYQKWNDFAKNDILPLLRKKIPDAGLVECQDFIFSFRYLETPEGAKPYGGVQHWLYRAENRWDEFREEGFIELGFSEIGDLSEYPTKDAVSTAFSVQYGRTAKNDELACFEFSHEMKEGDVVIVTKGLRSYVGYGVVESGYRFEDTGGRARSTRKVRWLKTGEWMETGEETGLKQLVMKGLTNITKYPDYIEAIIRLIEITATPMNGYSQMNTILYGVPGTGKTHHTVNYALSVLEGVPLENLEKEDRASLNHRFRQFVKDERVVFTTFHQSFSYEEFIEGLRASSEDGSVTYDVEDGIFKRICDEARKNWELSGKDDATILVESSVSRRIWDFVDESIQKGTKFKTVRGSEFMITEADENKVVLFSDAAKKLNNEIKIRMDDIRDLMLNGDGELSLGDLPDFFKRTGRRQPDSYLWTLYDAIKKKDISGIAKTESVDKTLKNYVIIIDEINRGNISKIFGELITLIEPTKRLGSPEAVELKLPYSKKLFGVPKNLFIIGTMNTADRSIALMDIALRRRFVFKEMLPEPSLLDGLKVDEIEVKTMFETLNERIEYLYDRDHRLGHAMFLPLKTEPSMAKLNEILLNGVLPLLQEYFYDDWEKIQIVLGDHPRQNFKQPRHRIVTSKPWKEEDVLGFDHDELSDEKVSYAVNTEISQESYIGIYKPAASNG